MTSSARWESPREEHDNSSSKVDFSPLVISDKVVEVVTAGATTRSGRQGRRRSGKWIAKEGGWARGLADRHTRTNCCHPRRPAKVHTSSHRAALKHVPPCRTHSTSIPHMLPAIKTGTGGEADHGRCSNSRSGSAGSVGVVPRPPAPSGFDPAAPLHRRTSRSSLQSRGEKTGIRSSPARRRGSRNRMTWLLPQELKESHFRTCKKKDAEAKLGAFGCGADIGPDTNELPSTRVVEATRSVISQRRHTEEARHRAYKQHLRDQKEMGRQRREHLLEETRRKMQAVKDERRRRQQQVDPNCHGGANRA